MRLGSLGFRFGDFRFGVWGSVFGRRAWGWGFRGFSFGFGLHAFSGFCQGLVRFMGVLVSGCERFWTGGHGGFF